MAFIRNFSLLFVVFALTAAFAQEVVEEDGCIMDPKECTCAESPSAGECTRPVEGGKCLQDDCMPSFKCDCFGYELCSISTCGRWTPAVNAILSRTSEFQCKYEATGSKCRTATSFLDTLSGADNAKIASIKYVDDISVDEVEVASDLKESLSFKIATLDACRAVTTRSDEVSVEEMTDLNSLSDAVIEETKAISKEIASVGEDAAEAYTSMGKARLARALAREHEAAAKAEEMAEAEAAEKAKKENKVCIPCEEMKARVKKLRLARKQAAIEAGTWSKKGRGARSRANIKRTSAKKRKAKVQLTSAQCVARAQKILNRLGGGSR